MFTRHRDLLDDFFVTFVEALVDQNSSNLFVELRIGILTALYERAVGYYASLPHVKAYHQVGVESGKEAGLLWQFSICKVVFWTAVKTPKMPPRLSEISPHRFDANKTPSMCLKYATLVRRTHAIGVTKSASDDSFPTKCLKA